MKNGLKIVIGILGILGFLTFGYVVLIVYINLPGGITIVKDLPVTPEWTEVAISPSLTPTKRVQNINLRISDFKVDRNSNSFDIKLPDGTIVRPEIEVYDEFGNKFEFRHSGFLMKTYDDVAFSPGQELPRNRSFTKLRIRSNVSFSCEQIYWLDHNLK